MDAVAYAGEKRDGARLACVLRAYGREGRFSDTRTTRERSEEGPRSPFASRPTRKKTERKDPFPGRRGTTTGANEHRDRVEPRRRVNRPEARRAAGAERLSGGARAATKTRVARARASRDSAGAITSCALRADVDASRVASERRKRSRRKSESGRRCLDRRAPFAAAKRPGEARRAERGGGRARERGHVVGRRMRRTTREVVRVSMWTRPRDGKGDGGILSSQHPGSGALGLAAPKIFSNQIKRNWQTGRRTSSYKSRLGRDFRRITLREVSTWCIFTSRVWKTTRVGEGRARVKRRRALLR